MKKILFLLILVFALTGCVGEAKINTEYDSIKLEVIGTMSAGCNSSEDTYLSHHYKDNHVYELDYKNNIDYYQHDNFVVYNDKTAQYVSVDRGKTFNEGDLREFEPNYRLFLDEMLGYIVSNKKEKIEEKDGYTTYNVNIHEKERAFEIIKKFGIVNNDAIINEINTLVTIDKKGNVVEIKFELKTTSSSEIKIQSCYDVYWNFSKYNEISLENFHKSDK